MSGQVFELEDVDITFLQRRPGHHDLVANDLDRGLLLIDPWRGRIVDRRPFTDGVAGAGCIDSWCLRADGKLAIVFNDERQRGCLVRFDGGPPTDVQYPAWNDTVAMPYDWRGDDLWLKHPRLFEFGVVRGVDLATCRPSDGFEALQENRGWRRAIDRRRRVDGHSAHVEPELGRMLWFSAPEEGQPRIGTVSWVGDPDLSVPVDQVPPRLAASGTTLIALHEYRVEVITETGQRVAELPPAPGFHYMAVEAIAASEPHPAAFVTAAHALDGRALMRFEVVPLPPLG